MLGHREMGLEDYLAIGRRHFWLILIPTVLGPVLSYGFSRTLKNRYTSQTLVLVEQQRVPEGFVRSVVTEQLSERLSSMQEQILSRTRLQPIIENNGLFREEMGRVPMEDLVDRMRKAVTVTPLKPTTTTQTSISGFYISYTGDTPRMSRDVCAQITSLFMEENIRRRGDQAESTTKFLQKQLDDAKAKLDAQDARLAEFKRRFLGQLPGQEQVNMNVLLSVKSQLEAVTNLLIRTQQDKAYTESILAQQISAWQASQTGSNPQTLETQLASLQNQLVTLEARYTADHPDVIKLKGDIAQLKKKIDEAGLLAKDKPVEKAQKASTVEPGQIQQLRNMIHQAEQTIREKTREQERLQEQAKVFEARVQLSPMIEQQYKELTRDFETAQSFYNDLLNKRNQSEMATDLERRQQGEQFRVMDPANLPARPSWPNRQLFALGGLGVGAGLGLGITLLLEMRDKSIRTERDVQFFLELATLTLVPSVTEPGKNHKGAWDWIRGATRAGAPRAARS